MSQLPERPEALPLIRIGDGVALAEDLTHQRALGAIPTSDLLSDASVKGTEVVFHLPKVGQQFAGERYELMEPLLQHPVVDHLDVALAHLCDLRVDLATSALEICQPDLRVGFGAHRHLFQQIEQTAQPRLGADERPIRQPGHPRDRLLRCGGEVEKRLVGADGIEAA